MKVSTASIATMSGSEGDGENGNMWINRKSKNPANGIPNNHDSGIAWLSARAAQWAINIVPRLHKKPSMDLLSNEVYERFPFKIRTKTGDLVQVDGYLISGLAR